MAIQIILCVETTRNADTDTKYIRDSIRHFYNIDNSVKLNTVYMNSKDKYNSSKVLKEITSKNKMFERIGESVVVYCIDTDSIDTKNEDKMQFDKIAQFCIQNGYELVWFCHDVEEVFVGHKVHNAKKVKEAAEFQRKNQISNIDKSRLRCKSIKVHGSNLLLVLDKYLKLK